MINNPLPSPPPPPPKRKNRKTIIWETFNLPWSIRYRNIWMRVEVWNWFYGGKHTLNRSNYILEKNTCVLVRSKMFCQMEKLYLGCFFIWWFCFHYFKEQVLIYVSNSHEMCTLCFCSPSNAYCVHYMLVYIVWHLLNLFRLVYVQLTSSWIMVNF